MNQNKSALRGSLLLLITATIWGVAFVAQSVGMDYVGPFTFNCTRSIIAILVLLPMVPLFDRTKASSPQKNLSAPSNAKTLWIGGIICGFFLACASNLQQIGLIYTNVGKAAFITTLYIILVPILGLLIHKPCSRFVWIAVLLALIGLYLLCIKDQFSLGKADLLLILCAVLFAFQILSVDHFTPMVSGIKLSLIQLLTNTVVSGILMFLFEKPDLHQLLAAWLPLLYAGALSSGIAYTLQIVAQKDLPPAIASLIMSLESCISAIAGWLILHQKLSRRELLGCVIMFLAVLLAQLPSGQANPRQKTNPQSAVPHA